MFLVIICLIMEYQFIYKKKNIYIYIYIYINIYYFLGGPRLLMEIWFSILTFRLRLVLFHLLISRSCSALYSLLRVALFTIWWSRRFPLLICLLAFMAGAATKMHCHLCAGAASRPRQVVQSSQNSELDRPGEASYNRAGRNEGQISPNSGEPGSIPER